MSPFAVADPPSPFPMEMAKGVHQERPSQQSPAPPPCPQSPLEKAWRATMASKRNGSGVFAQGHSELGMRGGHPRVSTIPADLQHPILRWGGGSGAPTKMTLPQAREGLQGRPFPNNRETGSYYESLNCPAATEGGVTVSPPKSGGGGQGKASGSQSQTPVLCRVQSGRPSAASLRVDPPRPPWGGERGPGPGQGPPP